MSSIIRAKYEKIPQDIKRDIVLVKFSNYHDYLSSFVASRDLELVGLSPAADIVSYGMGKTVSLTEKEYNRRVNKVIEYFKPYKTAGKLCSSGMREFPDRLLQELAYREKPNIQGKVATIIFLREINHLGHEISGYIDYRHRLNHQNWNHYFRGNKKLMPKVTDLCHYNWKNRQVLSNDTENFFVKSDTHLGLVFLCRHDNRLICPDSVTECTERTEVKTNKYLQAVIYDHILMRKIDLSKF